MSITVEVNGVLYDRIVSATVTERLDVLSNSFSFEAVGDAVYPLPFAIDDECRMYVDDELVLTGYIELVNVDGNKDNHSVTFAGRDRTADLLDSELGVIHDLDGTLSLKRIAELVIAHLAPNATADERLQVIDNVSPPFFNPAEDKITPEPGVGAMEFLERLARKRAVMLGSDERGDVVILDPSGQNIEAWVHQRKDSLDNNVRAYAMSYDATGLFNRYLSQSQGNPNAMNLSGLFSVEAMVDQSGEVRDVSVREGRQRVLVSESAFSDPQNAQRARWERNVRRARGRRFTATVAGYQNQAGQRWRTNTLPWVISEAAGINTRMLVSTVTAGYGLGDGEQTQLTFVEADAYTLDLAEPTVEEKVTGGLGGLFG